MKMKDNLGYKIFRSEIYPNSCANFLYEKISKSLDEKEKLFIALSGGSTPMPILKLLKEFPLEWERLVFFQVDERCVSIESEDSNYKQLTTHFFKHIGSEFHRMYDETLGVEKSVEVYENLLKNISFDLILLGMGGDGHTASLFPNTTALKENKRKVCMNYVPKLNSTRITLTYPIIIESEEIVVLLKGQDKINVFREIEKGATEYPIVKIIQEAKKIIWLIGE